MPAGRRTGATAQAVDVRLLLRRYVPWLRYDSLESFRADSAAVLPEHYVPAGTGWSATNVLRRKDGTVLAAARPRPGQAALTLDHLGRSRYADGVTVRRDDVLDAVGRDYVADARRMHAEPRYADVCYGSAAHDRDGAIWLQYWFFYYYNDKTYFGYGAHEGDWEMIQLRLGADTVPTVATYAQHSGGQAFRWTDLDRRNADGHPVAVVFVGRGSHASFARAGTHAPAPYPGVPPDYADGRGTRVRPRLEIVGDAAPGWASWPGLWGSSGTSPRGPATKRQWNDPGGFHQAAASGPGPAAGVAPPPPAPPAPRISVQRVDDRALVDYRFPARLRAGAPRPSWIVIALQGREDDLPPATYSFPVRAEHGAVAHPLALDDGSYVVRATAYSEGGVASRVVTAPVPA